MPTYRKLGIPPYTDEEVPGSYGEEGGGDDPMGMGAMGGMEAAQANGGQSTEAWLNQQEARHRSPGGIEEDLTMLGVEGGGGGGVEQLLASLGGEGMEGGELTPPEGPEAQVAAMSDLIGGLTNKGGPNSAATGDVAVPWVPEENQEELLAAHTPVQRRGLLRTSDFV
jgi:hypothetical protein